MSVKIKTSEFFSYSSIFKFQRHYQIPTEYNDESVVLMHRSQKLVYTDDYNYHHVISFVWSCFEYKVPMHFRT